MYSSNNVEVQQDGKNNHTSTMRGTRCRNNKPDVTPMAESSFTEMEAAAVVETSAPNTTGAIPKHKQHHKKRTKPTSSSTQLKARNQIGLWTKCNTYIVCILLCT